MFFILRLKDNHIVLDLNGRQGLDPKCVRFRGWFTHWIH